jgi:hypothetical protein
MEAIAAADVAVGAVIPEASAAPVSAVEADAKISEAIVEAAVVADEGAPVAGIPSIAAETKAPIAGRPKRANVGWLNPGSLYPLVAITGPGPIAGGPDVAVAWGIGLLVVGDWRRRLIGHSGCGLLGCSGAAILLIRVTLLRLLAILVLRILRIVLLIILLHVWWRTCGAVRISSWGLRKSYSGKNKTREHCGCDRISKETSGRHVFTCPLTFVCPALPSCDRTSRRAKPSSSRAISPRSSAQLIRHEVAPFVAGMLQRSLVTIC